MICFLQDTFGIDDNVSDGDPLCIINDQTSVMFESELYKDEELMECHHPSISESNSEITYQEPSISKILSFNDFFEILTFLVLVMFGIV